MTLVEIAISLSILVTILLGFSTALMSSMKASHTSREAAVATDAAREIMETLQASDFDTLFQNNNSVAADDVGGMPARLAAFAVDGLNPRSGDADGLCGEILLPEVVAGGVSQLREDVSIPALNMPRDLNGDGIVDNADHVGDYMILPVLVRVDWRGTAGEGRVQFKTILSNF